MQAYLSHINPSYSCLISRQLLRLWAMICLLACIALPKALPQVISNHGAAITTTSGVFVTTKNIENNTGSIDNDGSLNMSGNFYNNANVKGDGNYNVDGDWTRTATGTFTPEASTASFLGNTNQTMTAPGGETFHNLVLNSDDATHQLILANNATTNNRFTLAKGNVNTDVNKLYLSNPDPAALIYTSANENRVIGRLERAMNSTSNYFFPIGTHDSINTLNFKPNIAPTGSLIARFVPEAPGNDTLPIPDPPIEVYETFEYGYWDVQANNGFSISDYDINLKARGFGPLQPVTRVIKRYTGGFWTVDGTHQNTTDNVAFRDNLTDNINPAGTQYALGKVRPRVLYHPRDTAICDSTDARFRVIVTGYGPLEYQWQLGSWNDLLDTAIYSGTANDTLFLTKTPISNHGNIYRVVITDIYNNSKNSNAARLTVDPVPIITNTILADTLCNNTSTNYILQSDVPGSTYAWNAIYNSPQIAGAANGGLPTIVQTLFNDTDSLEYVVYRVAATGPGITACLGDSTDFTTIVNPTLLADSGSFQYIGGRNIRCYGEENGTIELYPRGGFYPAPYRFEYFSGIDPIGTNNDTINNLPAGTYNYTVTDIIGCSYSSLIVLTQPDTMIITDSIVRTTCAGFVDGKIYAEVTGGTPAYTWNWRNPEGDFFSNKDSLVDLRYGDYILTITDLNSCKSRDSMWVIAPPAVSVGLNSISQYGNFNISCKGKTDGSIILNVDGTGENLDDYTFIWSDLLGNPIDTTKNLVNYGAGDYVIFIRDSIGCETNDYYALTEPGDLVISRTGTRYPGDFDISCYDLSDGIINIAMSGSHSYLPGMKYSWTKTENPSFTSNSKDINNLTIGTYNLSAIDSFNCIASKSFTLVQPDEILMTVTDSSNYHGYDVSCYKGSNAFINVDVTGGFGDFTYLWTSLDGTITDAESKNQSGLTRGSYTLKATDAINCSRNWDFLINEPDTLDIVPVLSNYNGYNIDCFGSSTGSVNLNTQGGVIPYQFEWSSGDGSGLQASIENQTGLTSGNYNVRIMDVNNCEGTWVFELIEPTKLISSNVPKTVSCFGINNGNVDLNIEGGVTPYTYLWSNGKTSQDIDSLYIGKYYVTTTDLNNCEVADSASITEPPEILISLNPLRKYNGLMISCYGEEDAEITAEISGGYGTYRFNWKETGDNTQDIEGIGAGIYTLEVTDDNECVVSDSVTIVQPAQLITEVYKINPTCFNSYDGEATVIPQGGNTGFEYLIEWSDGQTGQFAENLPAGTYQVSISDVNLCSIDTFTILEQPDPVEITPVVDPAWCPDKANGSIFVEANGGTPPYQLSWADGFEGGRLTDLKPGKYVLTTSDFNQCIRTDTIEVESSNRDCLRIPNAFTPDGDGYNDTWEIELIELYPDAMVDIFNRWGDLIYRSEKGYTNPWDGTSKGRELPIDSYHYVINPGGNRKPVTGSITIIR